MNFFRIKNYKKLYYELIIFFVTRTNIAIIPPEFFILNSFVYFCRLKLKHLIRLIQFIWRIH